MPKEYPVLDDRPINKWKVTELREELKKRNLAVKGLKDELVKRLDEAIQKEREALEMEERKGSERESESEPEPMSCDAQLEPEPMSCDAQLEPDCVQNVDDSQKHSANELSEADDTVAKVETSDLPKDVDSAKGKDDEPTGNSVHFATAGEIKDSDAPLETIPSADAHEGLSDGMASTERVLENKVHEDDVMTSSQNDDFLTEGSIPSEASLDNSDIVKEAVETKIISAEETHEPKFMEEDTCVNVLPDAPVGITSSIKNDPENEGLKHLKMDAEPDLSYPSTQVHEVIPNLGCQVKSDSIPTDTLPIYVTNELNHDLKPDNVQLEQDIARPEMVLPSSNKDLSGVGVDHPMDDKMPSKSHGLVGGTDDDKSTNENISMKNENADQSLVDVSVIEHMDNKASNSTELLEGLPKDGNFNEAQFSCKEESFEEQKIDVDGSTKETNFQGKQKGSSEEEIDVGGSTKATNFHVDVSTIEHNMDDKASNSTELLEGLSKDGNVKEDTFSCKEDDSFEEEKIDIGASSKGTDFIAMEHNMDKASNSTDLLEGLSKEGNLSEAEFSCKAKKSFEEEKIEFDGSTKESNFQDVSVIEHNMDDKSSTSTELLEGLSNDANLNEDKLSCKEKDSSREEKTDVGASTKETNFQEHNMDDSTELPEMLSKDASLNEDKFSSKEKDSSEEEKIDIDGSTKGTSFQDVSAIEHNNDHEASNSTELLEGLSKDGNLNEAEFSCKEKESLEKEKNVVGASTKDTNFQAEGESTDSGFGKVTDIADGEKLEKINLDQSSADDSMDEDIVDTKMFDSENISFEVGKNTEEPHTKEHGVELEGSSTDTTKSNVPSDVGEKKNILNLPDKRKFQDVAAPENKEPAKRQRKWNYESLKTSEPKNSSILLLTPRQISTPNLAGSGSMHIVDAPKERIVPESSRTPTDSLRIDNFVRPFTLKAVQELLGRTGKVCSFWMDHIKTHCYVTFSSVEEAIETRNAVYNLQWPMNGGRLLLADFVDPQDVKTRIDGPSKPTAPPVSDGPTAPQPQTTTSQPLPPAEKQQQAPWDQAERPHPLSRQLPAHDQRPIIKERVAKAPSPVVEKTEEETPMLTLDDLFRKTKTTPRIYYLPLTDEQVSAKLNKQQRSK